jgi:hypothetical protein
MAGVGKIADRPASFTKGVKGWIFLLSVCALLPEAAAAGVRTPKPPREAPGSATISANPTVVPIPAGQTEGATTLTWNGGKDHPYAEVWVKVGDQDEKFVLEQGQGSRQMKVKAGKTYLYMLEDGGRLLASVTVQATRAPDVTDAGPPTPPATKASPTAGARQILPISSAGQRLKDFYSSMNVESLWLAQHHVNWETGEPDNSEAQHGNKTHCSAFIAAACQRRGIYILRPPEHGQILLANAQADWLNSSAGRQAGWRKLPDNEELFSKAQQLANNGKVVVAIYKSPDPTKPGHAALVMPDERSAARLQSDGPEVIMAGTHNHNQISLKNGFRSHISEWPEHSIEFFEH